MPSGNKSVDNGRGTLVMSPGTAGGAWGYRMRRNGDGDKDNWL